MARSLGAEHLESFDDPVEGAFPAEFSLALYEPPPDGFLSSCASPACPANRACDTQYGVASILAAIPGQTEFTWPNPEPLGMDLEHVLVYVPTDMPADSMVSLYLHSTPTAGFHIYRVRQLTPDERADRAACMLAIAPARAGTPASARCRCRLRTVVAIARAMSAIASSPDASRTSMTFATWEMMLPGPRARAGLAPAPS